MQRSLGQRLHPCFLVTTGVRFRMMIKVWWDLPFETFLQLLSGLHLFDHLMNSSLIEYERASRVHSDDSLGLRAQVSTILYRPRDSSDRVLRRVVVAERNSSFRFLVLWTQEPLWLELEEVLISLPSILPYGSFDHSSCVARFVKTDLEMSPLHLNERSVRVLSQLFLVCGSVH